MKTLPVNLVRLADYKERVFVYLFDRRAELGYLMPLNARDENALIRLRIHTFHLQESHTARALRYHYVRYLFRLIGNDIAKFRLFKTDYEKVANLCARKYQYERVQDVLDIF